MLYYHLLCIVFAYLLILYISVSLSVVLPNVANKRVHKRLKEGGVNKEREAGNPPSIL